MRYLQRIWGMKIISMLSFIVVSYSSYAYEIGDNINIIEQQELSFNRLAKNYNTLVLNNAKKLAEADQLAFESLAISEKFKYIAKAEAVLADKKPSISEYYLSRPKFVTNSNGSSRLNINLVKYRLGGGPEGGGVPFYVLMGKAVESDTTKNTTNADLTDIAGGMLNIKLADTFLQNRYKLKYICDDPDYNPCTSSYELGAKLLEYPTAAGGVGYSGSVFLNLAFNKYTTIWNGGIKDGSLITSIFLSYNYLAKTDYKKELGKEVPDYLSANMLFKLYLRNVISISVAGPFYVATDKIQKSIMISLSTAN